MFFDPKDPRYNHCTVEEIKHLKKIMKEKIDLSLNRSLEELIASYWEAVNGEIDHTQYGSFYDIESYLMKKDVL